jgi:anaerobic sulfite reductase subunit C
LSQIKEFRRRPWHDHPMSQTKPAISPLRLDQCRGASGEGCPRLLFRDETLARELARVARELGFADHLLAKTKGRILHHHAFAVSVSGCPNGCSRPHIADLGLVPARQPKWSANECDQCLACLAACREGALDMIDTELHIDRSRCLGCGDCLAACPSGALGYRAEGYRVVLGGKLGRRPRLGRELPGLWTARDAARVLRACLGLMMHECDPNVRFAQALDTAGEAFFAGLCELS